MPASALALTLAAAVLHAGWNVLVAGARDLRATTSNILVLSLFLFAPIAVATWEVERAAIPWIVLSAVLHFAYFLLLVTAYSRSDLTLVYPVARGSAPVLVLVAATAFGVAAGALQAVGVVLVAAGVLLVGGIPGRTDRRGLLFALGIGAVIAGYTLADKEGIEHASPIAYLELVLAPGALAAVALELGSRRGAALQAAIGWRSLAAATGSFGAYALVLAALERAPAAAVAAVRESSILFAAVLGALVLSEPAGPGRFAGAALIVGGVALVALG